MKAILTSSLGGSAYINGTFIPAMILEKNGLLDRLKSIWIKQAEVLIISASPNNYEMNDCICACFKEAFPMSGLTISHMNTCDDRNTEIIDTLKEMDVIILTGGHVPTQNRFIKQINLKERLVDFKGIVIGWSAGSMNCAEIVYAGPELEGEAVDPSYERWIPGLGITSINIVPHFQSLKDEYLDGLRLIEDITFTDSKDHEMLALNDGSYLMIADEQETLYGEAYLIKDGCVKQICKDDESLVIKKSLDSTSKNLNL